MSLISSELNQLRDTASARVEQVIDLAQRICVVPSPTGHEQQRGEFVASLFRERGYTPDIDEVGNVYVRRGNRGKGPVVMILAHLDTVFPFSTPIIPRREGDILYAPGIGDNSLSVATMISVLDVLDALGLETDVDIIAVADVGEEGLGDLRGARAAVKRYQADLGAVIVLDGGLGRIVNVAVGSKRWRINVHGPGGHSFGAFGRPSAIHGLGKIIAALADMQVPREPKTTFNVGVIEGGTTVNTIAAHATALLDLRSTEAEALERLAAQAEEIITHCAGEGLSTEIEVLSERPAGKRSLTDPLVQLAAQTLRWLGLEPIYEASSTDANVPIGLNIPAVCVGITRVEQFHTVEEHIYLSPIGTGLAQAVRLCLEASTLVASSQK